MDGPLKDENTEYTKEEIKKYWIELAKSCIESNKLMVIEPNCEE